MCILMGIIQELFLQIIKYRMQTKNLTRKWFELGCDWWASSELKRTYLYPI